MRNLFALFTAAVFVSCSGNKKEAETPKKVWVCDSIIETSFDSEGKETINRRVHCDSVLLSERPKKVWVCDTIQESSFDADGNEILTAKLFCDSVLQKPGESK